MAVPTKQQLKDFVHIEGDWTELPTTGHHYFTKPLADDRLLRLRISLGRGAAFDDPGLWNRVWRVQLGLDSEDQFWNTLRTKQPARRGAPLSPQPTTPPKPAWLVDHLVHRTGLPERDVLAMSEDEAMEIYLAHIHQSPDAG